MKGCLFILIISLCVAGCDGANPVAGLDADAVQTPSAAQSITDAAFSASKKGQATAVSRPFALAKSRMQADWAIDRAQELACGGSEIAGGSSSGAGTFTHLGKSTVVVSIAWNIGALLNPTDVQFTPVGPAGGPVAPVLGPGDYPYDFHFNPFTGQCGQVVSATGEVEITAANGDRVYGIVSGGETHRLDYLNPGDGVENFAIVEITGGSGRFEHAGGGFTMHSIVRFDYDAGRFVVDLSEMLPGGTISY